MPGTETVKEKKDTRRRGKGRKSKSSSSSKKAAHQQEEEHFEEEFQQEQEQLDQPITNEDVKDEQEQVEQGNENKIDNMFVESTSATVDAKVNEDPFSIPVADYGRLDLDVIQYFQGVEKMLDDEEKFETVEDRALFVSNVYREVELKELKVATDPESSRVLEKLLRASNDFQLRIFADRLRGSYASLFTHRFASHVCQTLLVLAADVMERELRGKSKLEGMDEATLESLKELPTMQQIFLDICEQLENYFVALMSDQFGSHLVRVILNILTGEALISESENRSKKSKKYNGRKNNVWELKKAMPKSNSNDKTNANNAGYRAQRATPPVFKQVLEKMTTTITSALGPNEFRVLATHQQANPVLQLLIIVQATKLETPNYSLIAAILDIPNISNPVMQRNDYVDTVLKHVVGSRLFEKIIEFAPHNISHALYTTYFRNQLFDLALHPVANYVVANLIAHVGKPQLLQLLLDEIVPADGDAANGLLSKLIKRNKHGIIVELVKACYKHQLGHSQLFKTLLAAFGCNTETGRKSFMKCALLMQTLDRVQQQQSAPQAAAMHTERSNRFQNTQSTGPTVQGVLLLTNLLNFPIEYNRVIIESYFALPFEETFAWCLDDVASRFMEALFTSNEVGLKIKRKIMMTFVGHYTRLASNKNGGHIVDAIWKLADVDLKTKIVEDLEPSFSTLANDFYGKFIVRNVKLEMFKKSRQEWLENQRGIEKKVAMFSEFLEDSGKKKDDSKKEDKQDLSGLHDQLNMSTELATLGFGSSNAEASSSSSSSKKEKKKDKKKSKSSKTNIDNNQQEEINTLDLLPDASESLAVGESSSKEIDALFKTKKGDVGAVNMSLDEITPVATPVTGKKDKLLNDVLGAIEGTKKKRKKSKKDDGEEDGEQKKKKKKFMA